MKSPVWGIAFLALMAMGAGAEAENAARLAALKGLAPVSALSNSAAGRAALAANFSVTGGIQTGAIRQPTLMPFAEQQQQALRDAFITDGNLAELADGLGATLGAAYQARAHYLDRETLHQRLRGGQKPDRLRQLDVGIRFERWQIFLRQWHDQRQTAGLGRGDGDLQGGRRRSRPVWTRL